MKVQDKILEVLTNDHTGLTPTQIGLLCGYNYNSASSSVHKPLARLVEKGLITRKSNAHKVIYFIKKWADILEDVIKENKTV